MSKPRNEIKDLKQFGSVLAGILFIFSTINFLKGRTFWYPWFFGFGVVCVFLVFAAPRYIKPIFIVFSKVGHAIGWLNTRVILALIYYIFITPIAVSMKIFNKDPLSRKVNKTELTYWTRRAITKPTRERLEKQF